MESPAGEVTQLVMAGSKGDRSVEERLFRLVLAELRTLAGGLARKEHREHTFQPSALLNEAYLRLVADRERHQETKRHFFAIAAHIMRRLQINYVRAQTKLPIGSQADPLPPANGRLEKAIAVDRLLAELQSSHPAWCSIVELKCFMGFTDAETAEVLSLPLR